MARLAVAGHVEARLASGNGYAGNVTVRSGPGDGAWYEVRVTISDPVGGHTE